MSLLEAFVALTVVSGVIATAIAVTQETIKRTVYAQLRIEAASVADAIVARVGNDIPLEPGHSQQIAKNGVAWDLEVQPIASRAETLRAYQIKVDVRISRGWLTEHQSIDALKLNSGMLR